MLPANIDPTLSQSAQWDQLLSISHDLSSLITARYRIPYPDNEDIYQHSLLLTWRARDRITDSLAGFFLITVRNRCVIYWRDKRHGKGLKITYLDEGMIDNSECYSLTPLGTRRLEARQEIERVIKLVGKHRDATLLLLTAQGFHDHEIERSTKYSRHALQNSYRKARHRIKDKLAEKGVVIRLAKLDSREP